MDSVRSRVVNLKELNPDLTIEALKAALTTSFCDVYALPLQTLSESDLDMDRILALTARNRSWEWNYGQKLPFTLDCEDRFPWGNLQIQLQITTGVIQQAKVYSDSMDWSFTPELEKNWRAAGLTIRPCSPGSAAYLLQRISADCCAVADNTCVLRKIQIHANNAPSYGIMLFAFP